MTLSYVNLTNSDILFSILEYNYRDNFLIYLVENHPNFFNEKKKKISQNYNFIWKTICGPKFKLSLSFIEKHFYKLDKKWLARYQKLSRKFINKYKTEFNFYWKIIANYQDYYDDNDPEKYIWFTKY